jgi:hypothetical protein
MSGLVNQTNSEPAKVSPRSRELHHSSPFSLFITLFIIPHPLLLCSAALSPTLPTTISASGAAIVCSASAAAASALASHRQTPHSPLTHRASTDGAFISRDVSDRAIVTMQSEGLQQQVSQRTDALAFPRNSTQMFQDGLMDVLAASASRQKEIARAIAGELKEQDVILEDLEDEVDDAEEVTTIPIEWRLKPRSEAMCYLLLRVLTALA